MAKTKSTNSKVGFQFSSSEAKSVALAADFTNWELNPLPMKKGKDGKWKTTVSLAPGRYEYKLIVDGQWLEDPDCTEKCPNSYGGSNSVRYIT